MVVDLDDLRYTMPTGGTVQLKTVKDRLVIHCLTSGPPVKNWDKLRVKQVAIIGAHNINNTFQLREGIEWRFYLKSGVRITGLNSGDVQPSAGL